MFLKFQLPTKSPVLWAVNTGASPAVGSTEDTAYERPLGSFRVRGGVGAPKGWAEELAWEGVGFMKVSSTGSSPSCWAAKFPLEYSGHYEVWCFPWLSLGEETSGGFPAPVEYICTFLSTRVLF